MEFKENQICPKCGEYMLQMFGCGWDYDRLICGDRDCDYEIEFETTTNIDDD
jgi:ribosomal protein S27AE